MKPRMNAGMGGIKKGTLGRLLRYLLHWYRWRLLLVAVCIIVGAVASMVGTMFMRRLIDNCIVPGITNGLDAVWKDLLSVIASMAVIYLFGVVATALQTRTMAQVGQGSLKHLRDDMFDAMEALPIRYFDTHPRGDIMSTYTNDADAIRQLIAQSLPNLLQSALSIITSFALMLSYSVWMTLVVIVVLIAMLRITKHYGSLSGKFMGAQQASLAKTEGYIEEMIQGQKVV